MTFIHKDNMNFFFQIFMLNVIIEYQIHYMVCCKNVRACVFVYELFFLEFLCSM